MAKLLKDLITELTGKEVEVRSTQVTIKGTMTLESDYVEVTPNYNTGKRYYIPVNSIDIIITEEGV